MDSIENKLLNHKCINCKFINTKDFTRCYCELTMKRIKFKNDIFSFCPLLDIGMCELKAPYLDEECYVLLNDGAVVLVKGDASYNYNLNEYEYFCDTYDGGWTYSSHEKIKHSDIKKVFKNRIEASEHIKRNKLSHITKFYCDEFRERKI